MKLGFEVEAFCFDKDGQAILVPANLPMDECGWLVEVRSEPHSNITKAIYLLKAEDLEVQRRAEGAGVQLLFEPVYDIPRDLKVQALRRADTNKHVRYRNIYGHENHRTKLATAALHVSFTNEQEFSYLDKDGRWQKRPYPGFVDHARLIVGLDVAFKDEIRKAGRNPGFYEVKHDGRIEYKILA